MNDPDVIFLSSDDDEPDDATRIFIPRNKTQRSNHIDRRAQMERCNKYVFSCSAAMPSASINSSTNAESRSNESGTSKNASTSEQTETPVLDSKTETEIKSDQLSESPKKCSKSNDRKRRHRTNEREETELKRPKTDTKRKYGHSSRANKNGDDSLPELRDEQNEQQQPTKISSTKKLVLNLISTKNNDHSLSDVSSEDLNVSNCSFGTDQEVVFIPDSDDDEPPYVDHHLIYSADAQKIEHISSKEIESLDKCASNNSQTDAVFPIIETAERSPEKPVCETRDSLPKQYSLAESICRDFSDNESPERYPESTSTSNIESNPKSSADNSLDKNKATKHKGGVESKSKRDKHNKNKRLRDLSEKTDGKIQSKSSKETNVVTPSKLTNDEIEQKCLVKSKSRHDKRKESASKTDTSLGHSSKKTKIEIQSKSPNETNVAGPSKATTDEIEANNNISLGKKPSTMAGPSKSTTVEIEENNNISLDKRSKSSSNKTKHSHSRDKKIKPKTSKATVPENDISSGWPGDTTNTRSMSPKQIGETESRDNAPLSRPVSNDTESMYGGVNNDAADISPKPESLTTIHSLDRLPENNEKPTIVLNGSVTAKSDSEQLSIIEKLENVGEESNTKETIIEPSSEWMVKFPNSLKGSEYISSSDVCESHGSTSLPETDTIPDSMPSQSTPKYDPVALQLISLLEEDDVFFEKTKDFACQTEDLDQISANLPANVVDQKPSNEAKDAQCQTETVEFVSNEPDTSVTPLLDKNVNVPMITVAVSLVDNPHKKVWSVDTQTERNTVNIGCQTGIVDPTARSINAIFNSLDAEPSLKYLFSLDILASFVQSHIIYLMHVKTQNEQLDRLKNPQSAVDKMMTFIIQNTYDLFHMRSKEHLIWAYRELYVLINQLMRNDKVKFCHLLAECIRAESSSYNLISEDLPTSSDFVKTFVQGNCLEPNSLLPKKGKKLLIFPELEQTQPLESNLMQSSNSDDLLTLLRESQKKRAEANQTQSSELAMVKLPKFSPQTENQMVCQESASASMHQMAPLIQLSQQNIGLNVGHPDVSGESSRHTVSSPQANGAQAVGQATANANQQQTATVIKSPQSNVVLGVGHPDLSGKSLHQTVSSPPHANSFVDQTHNPMPVWQHSQLTAQRESTLISTQPPTVNSVEPRQTDLPQSASQSSGQPRNPIYYTMPLPDTVPHTSYQRVSSQADVFVEPFTNQMWPQQPQTNIQRAPGPLTSPQQTQSFTTPFNIDQFNLQQSVAQPFGQSSMQNMHTAASVQSQPSLMVSHTNNVQLHSSHLSAAKQRQMQPQPQPSPPQNESNKTARTQHVQAAPQHIQAAPQHIQASQSELEKQLRFPNYFQCIQQQNQYAAAPVAQLHQTQSNSMPNRQDSSVPMNVTAYSPIAQNYMPPPPMYMPPPQRSSSVAPTNPYPRSGRY